MTKIAKRGETAWTPFGSLAPCPSCGGEPQLPWPAPPSAEGSSEAWRVRCPACGFAGPACDYPSTAADSWNARADDMRVARAEGRLP